MVNRYRIVFDAKFSLKGVYSVVRSSALILASDKDSAVERFKNELMLGEYKVPFGTFQNGGIYIVRVEEGWKWNSRQRKEKIDDAIKTLRLCLSPEEFEELYLQKPQ